MTDDAQLWRAVQRGSADAFTELFERHADRVYSHLRRCTGSWSDAEDLTGAVFLLVWEKRSRELPDDAELLPWLLSVATNVARNARRSQRRYERALARLPSSFPPIADPAEDVAERLDARIRLAQVYEAMNALPEHERTALRTLLAAEQGLAPAEKHESTGTFGSRVSRGRRHLRALLNQPPKEGDPT